MAGVPVSHTVVAYQGVVTTAPISTAPSSDLSERDKAEIKRLRSKHSDYEHSEQHWNFLLRSYEGGPCYASTETLFRHSREQAQDYEDRLRRAHYQNYCCPIVDFVPEFIFNHPIERDARGAVKPLFDKFVHDVDRNGTPLDQFMQQVSEDARLFGHCFVQVDKPQAPEGRELSQADVIELGLNLPYLVLVRPLEVLDWRTDQFSNYIYLKRVQYLTIEDGEDIKDVERYTEWFRKRYKITVVDVTDSDKPKILDSKEYPNAWNVVPFVPVFHKRSKSNRELGISAIGDIAYQNRDVFNLTSLIGEFLYRQAFNILVMEEDSAAPPERSNIEGTLGTSNVLTFPTGVSHPPQYLTPPADPAAFIQTERDKAIAEMYRQAAQDIASELFAGSNRSGDAARQAFGRTIPVIAKAADALQQAEVQILTLWAKIQNQKWEGKIAYKDSFEITNLQDLLLQLSTIFNNLHVISPTFIREEWRRIVREFDGRIERSQLDKIFKEIDGISDQELKDFYAVPADVKSTEGVPSTAQMIQGRNQKRLRSDRNISLATGNNASTKEANPDANKRTRVSRK